MLDNFFFTLGYSTVEFHCLFVLDVFLYIPRLVLVFQDVSVIYELYDLPHSQMFSWGITVLDQSLHTSIVGVTVWHLGSPNDILVRSFVFHTFCPVTFVILSCLFSSLHIMCHIAFCYISLPAKYLHSILLQLTFS